MNHDLNCESRALDRYSLGKVRVCTQGGQGDRRGFEIRSTHTEEAFLLEGEVNLAGLNVVHHLGEISCGKPLRVLLLIRFDVEVIFDSGLTLLISQIPLDVVGL